MTLCQQLFGEMTANKAATASDECFHLSYF